MPSPKNTPTALTHVGGPTVLIEYGGLRLVSDPAFDAAGSTYKVSGLLPLAKTDEPALPAAELGHIDAVLVSHDQHADNFDRAGRQLARDVLGQERGAVLTTPQAAKRIVGATGLRPFESTELDAPAGPVTVTAMPARHAHGVVAAIAGPVTGFLLTAPGLPTLYVSGDNISPAATAKVAAHAPVDVAVLHAGAPRFTATGPIRFCMTAAQVADAVATLGAPRTLVVHSDGWGHFSETPADVDAAFAAAPASIQQARIVAKPGERVTIKG